MRFDTELRIFEERQEDILEKYIDSCIAGNIKNLIIKEDVIMLERLKEQREVYVAELEKVKAIDLELIKAERFELAKDEISRQVEREHQAEIDKAELKIAHYDFVIADEEAKAEAELARAEEEKIEEVSVHEVIGG